MMSRKNQVRLPSTLPEYLAYLEKAFRVLPINGLVAARSISFSSAYPRDPTDRMIGATSVVHRVPLVTRDEKIRASKEVDCIW